LSSRINELLKRTLVIVAHPDDECIGAGALLQRIADPVLVFCTDGGPRDSYFWHAFGSREAYVEVRRREVAAAAESVGVKKQRSLPIVDQELYKNLELAVRELERLVLECRPQAVLTLAYEGGHPDHDSCAFIGHVIGERQKLPVWEMPLYHRTSQGPRPQQFLRPGAGIEQLDITADELTRKRKMVACYGSQGELANFFDLSLELFRPQAQYDFLRPPDTDVINYEFWQWPTAAGMVCQAFAAARTHLVSAEMHK
jgi:LmbE family N-acetylglucosaminyl deacetylase